MKSKTNLGSKATLLIETVGDNERLAKLIKEDAGNIQRELKKLEKAGFLISEKQGNTKVYYTNKHFLIFKELQSIVLKSQRAAQKRQQSL